MTINTIKAQIQRLAEEHHAIDEVNLEDLKDTESLELDAEVLIKEYCEKQGYQVQGFPHEKRKINDEEHDEDYFSLERFRMYLDHLTLTHNDVADLKWFYVDRFWPNWFENKKEYLNEIISGFKDGSAYDIEF